MTNRDLLEPLPTWVAPPLPTRTVIRGRYVQLEPLSVDHVEGLFSAQHESPGGEMFKYLPVGPFSNVAAYRAWVDVERLKHDPMHFAVRMNDGRLGGTLSLMRMDPTNGVIETGWLIFSPRLQRTRESTEAVYVLMKWAFEAGYRRFEWKCDAANAPSMTAAHRFGFQFEGVFRQAAIVKGRNRDTAWFSILDSEWPDVRDAFEAWLAASNFDESGAQIAKLTTQD